MYTIKKAAHIVDELRIEDGDKTLTVNVNIFIDDILADVARCQKKIALAQAKIKENKTDEDALAALGEAVIALFGLLFGEEQTKAIVGFYENRTASMLADFLPYITQEILPKVREAQEALAATYKSWK
jgi:hypothetical protein